MKNKFITNTTIMLAVIAICGLSLVGCEKGSPKKGENLSKDGSYVIGMQFGSMLAGDSIVPNMNELIKGMKDVASGKEPRFTETEAMMILQAAFDEMMQARESEAVETEKVFLSENRQKAGVQETLSGLQYEVLVEAAGPKPGPFDTVNVHYEGRFTDGEIFDSSYERGASADFHLTSMIPGFSEGLQLMSVGSKYRLFIPSELGYGAGSPYGMPPYATLIFEIELLDILE